MIREVKEQNEWNNFIRECGGHPLQLWGWGELKSKTGPWQAHRLIVDKQGGAEVLIRRLPWPFRAMAYIPRGPIITEQGSAQKVLDEIAKWAKQHRCIELKIEPNWLENTPIPRGFKLSRNNIQLARTVILDLSRSEDELLADATSNTRQLIRRSARSGVTVRETNNVADIKQCLEIYHDTAKRGGFNPHSDDYYYLLATLMGKDNHLFVAEYNSKIISFLWAVATPAIAFELYGGGRDEARKLRANYILKWEAIRTLRANGVEKYDINGLLNDGISNFKLGFSGNTETNLVGTLDRPLSSLYGLWEIAIPFGKRVIHSLRR